MPQVQRSGAGTAIDVAAAVLSLLSVASYIAQCSGHAELRFLDLALCAVFAGGENERAAASRMSHACSACAPRETHA